MAVAMETWSPPAMETWSPPAMVEEGLLQTFKGGRGVEVEKERQRRRIDWVGDVCWTIDGFSAGGWPIADVDFWRVGPETSDFDYDDMYIDVYSDDDDEDSSSSSSDDDSVPDPDRYNEGDDSDSGDVRRFQFKRHPDKIPDFFAKYPEDVREEVRTYFQHFVDECKYFGKITLPPPKLLFELDPTKSGHLAFPLFPDCAHPSLMEHIPPLQTFAKEALRRYNYRMVQNLVFEELVYANVWVHFPMAYFITFLAKDGSSTRFRCKAHVCAFRQSKEIRKIDLFTIEKDGFFEAQSETPYIREMPAYCEKAAISWHKSHNKRPEDFQVANHCSSLYNKVPYIREMPAQCDKAAISYHDSNHKKHIEFEVANHCASLYNEFPYIKEMPAQSENAAISFHDDNHKRHMEVEVANHCTSLYNELFKAANHCTLSRLPAQCEKAAISYHDCNHKRCMEFEDANHCASLDNDVSYIKEMTAQSEKAAISYNDNNNKRPVDFQVASHCSSLYNKVPYIREMPAQCDKAAISYHDSNHKKHMEFEVANHCASLYNEVPYIKQVPAQSENAAISFHDDNDKRHMEVEVANHCTSLYKELFNAANHCTLSRLPAQCEKAAVSYHNCNDKRRMEFEDANHCASLDNYVSYIKEMTAQSEKAAISYNDNSNKGLMAFKALKAKYFKDKAVILQAKSHVSDHMVLCPSKVIRYEGGACGYRYKADSFDELLQADRPYVNLKYKSDFIKKCAEAALKCYNEKMVTDFKLERITMATQTLLPGSSSYYVSFHAKDEPDGVESLFRARVFDYKDWGVVGAFEVDVVVRGLIVAAYPWKYSNC